MSPVAQSSVLLEHLNIALLNDSFTMAQQPMTRDQYAQALQSASLLTVPFQNILELTFQLARNIVLGAQEWEHDQLTCLPKVVTGLATLQSAVQDLSRAYIAHTNTVIGKTPGSSLELLNLAVPLGGENAIFGNRAATPAPNVEGGENKKRKRAPHDKNAPKRPVTPYFLYMKTARGEIAKEMTPGHTAKEVADEGTKRWLTMPPKEKQGWSDRYQVNFAAYKAKMKEYKAGRPIPEISEAEAKELLEEMKKRGEIKSEAPLDVGGPTEASDGSDTSSDTSSSEDESPEPAKEPSPPKSPPRASKRRKGAAAEKKPSPVKPTPAKEAEPTASPTANKSPEVEKKKKGSKKKDSKAVQEAEAKSAPAVAAASSPPKSTTQEKPKKTRKKRKSEAVDD
ncbi:MAG: hypothetical protein Q9191_007625 [Dirinaria sp. TL-2023a]